MGQFTQLRQQCCHPQIVRRDVWLGKTRLSMRQILTRLVTRAFGEYDAALRAEYSARLLLAAVQLAEQLCEPDCDGEGLHEQFCQPGHVCTCLVATGAQLQSSLNRMPGPLEPVHQKDAGMSSGRKKVAAGHPQFKGYICCEGAAGIGVALGNRVKGLCACCIWSMSCYCLTHKSWTRHAQLASSGLGWDGEIC